jgi:uncharacterized protein YabN with tetrapyrrole methylase and pyrophosphatase domain
MLNLPICTLLGSLENLFHKTKQKPVTCSLTKQGMKGQSFNSSTKELHDQSIGSGARVCLKVFEHRERVGKI